jgi:hypothetical protein
MESPVMCPQCGGATASYGANIRSEEDDLGKWMTVYVCQGSCTQEVPYPEDETKPFPHYSTWTFEFVIDETGKVIPVRPPADDFA